MTFDPPKRKGRRATFDPPKRKGRLAAVTERMNDRSRSLLGLSTSALPEQRPWPTAARMGHEWPVLATAVRRLPK